MTEANEQKKEYLRRYLDNVRAAKRIEEQIMTLRADKLYPSFILSDMPRSCNNKDLSEYAAKLDELLDELKMVRFRRIDTYSKIVRQIEIMEEEREREVLKYRYIDGYAWEKVAVMMHIEWAQVHRLHSKALMNFNIA